MDVSWEEASSLLQKHFGTTVVGLLMPVGEKGASCRLVGTLSQVADEGKPWLMVVATDNNAISFCIEGCICQYGDTREAPEEVRKSAERRFESVLSIINPKLRIALSIFEIRTSPWYRGGAALGANRTPVSVYLNV